MLDFLSLWHSQISLGRSEQVVQTCSRQTIPALGKVHLKYIISNISYLCLISRYLYLQSPPINITSVRITALPERLVECPSNPCPLCLCATRWPGSGDTSSRVYLFSSSVSCLLSGALQMLVTAHMCYEVSNITRINLYVPVTAGLVNWVWYYCWRIKFLWTFPWRAGDSRVPGCKKAVERVRRCDGAGVRWDGDRSPSPRRQAATTAVWWHREHDQHHHHHSISSGPTVWPQLVLIVLELPHTKLEWSLDRFIQSLELHTIHWPVESLQSKCLYSRVGPLLDLWCDVIAEETGKRSDQISDSSNLVLSVDTSVKSEERGGNEKE